MPPMPPQTSTPVNHAPPAMEALIETPRLRIRRLGVLDVDALLAVYGDAASMRWVGDGQPLDRAQCVQWVEVTHRNYALRGYGMFALVGRASGAAVGFAGLVHPGGQAEAELKYALLPAQWGQGLATEAASALLACAAARFGLRRVIATAAPENLASHRVLLKAGMQRGERRPNPDGSWTQLFAWSPGSHDAAASAAQPHAQLQPPRKEPV